MVFLNREEARGVIGKATAPDDWLGDDWLGVEFIC
jgi:hypothetical protein